MDYTNDVPLQQRARKPLPPVCDVDDIAFRNRHDPKFIAEITNLMQVPSTITVSNGHQSKYNGHMHDETFPMDIPEKLTAENILKERGDNGFTYHDKENLNNLDYDHVNSNGIDSSPQTPTGNNNSILSRSIGAADDNRLAKTPQISEELYKRMRPRRTSLEDDISLEIRLLRDKINHLEHECQFNTQANRVVYLFVCGYVLVKAFSWLFK